MGSRYKGTRVLHPVIIDINRRYHCMMIVILLSSTNIEKVFSYEQ